MKNKEIFKLTLSAIFLALTYVLPFLTGQIPEIGAMLCPMHIPVILCAYICGYKYGMIIGMVGPILRSLTLGMPPLYPSAICMSFELATYGLLSGLLYKKFKNNKISIYLSLIIAMIGGRAVWGIVMFICLGFDYNTFNLSAFFASAFISSIPGIIIQIIVIPMIIILYEKICIDRKGE